MENRIRELREERHMTQVRLSIELEVSQETVSAYESGKHYPSVASLIRLSQIFHTSCDYILGISDCRLINPLPSPSGNTERLLDKWQRLDKTQQEIVFAYIDGILDSHNITR